MNSEIKMIKFPSIEQYRNVIKNLREHFSYIGKDEEGKAIFDENMVFPTIKFTGTPKGHGTNVLYNDWRLPTIQELFTLVNYNKFNPACDLEDTKPEVYWSSSPCNSGSSKAWAVYFRNGNDGCNNKYYPNLVRYVRDGENGLEWSATSDIEMTWNEAMEYAKNLVAPVYYKR